MIDDEDDRDPDTAPGGHDWRIEQDMIDEADARRDPRRRMSRTFAIDGNAADELARIHREQFPALPSELRAIPIDQGDRHVLIVEPDGWTYIAPHQAAHPREFCAAVQEALEVFLERSAIPELDGPVLLPAFPSGDPNLSRRFWCSIDADGNFEIGGRVDA